MATNDLREGTCDLCGHKEVVCAKAIEFGAKGTSRQGAITYGGKDGMLGFQPKLDQGMGLLCTYTCRSCGYTQHFADEPGDIPIGQKYGTRLIKSK